MNKCCRIWQYFDKIICNILFEIWQDFVIVWQNTPCTVCYPAMACFTALVLLNSVASLQKWYNTIFYKNGAIFHASVHGRRKDFSRRTLVDFSKRFSMGGAKVV